MTQPTETLLAVAGRCEAATRADRELERVLIREAWEACFPAPESSWRPAVGFNDAWHAWNQQKAKVRHWLAAGALLDAAMTLVPAEADSVGETWRMEGYSDPGVLAPHVRASAWVAGVARVYAATPALALCAAALRARAASGVEG